jgi:hypothetical protein
LLLVTALALCGRPDAALLSVVIPLSKSRELGRKLFSYLLKKVS